MPPFFTDCTFVHYQIYTNAGRLSIPPAAFFEKYFAGARQRPRGHLVTRISGLSNPHPATALPQRVLVALVPLHELGDAVVQAPVGLVAAFRLEFRGIGVRLVNVAGLHRQEFLLRGLAIGVLDFGDKVHQLYRVAAADVVYFVRNAVRAFVGNRHVVERMHAALGDVIDVGEVTNHVTVVEHLDGLALRDGASKEHRAHVGAFPGQGRGRALAA